MKAGKAILVDVRERDELDAGMAEGARWYPTSSIKSDPDGYRKFVASLPEDRTIVFYCASGVRSGRAAEIASKEMGRKAANLGGFKDWKGAGLPVAVPAKSLQPG
jgi:rhodanese-related sulfurtransferase